MFMTAGMVTNTLISTGVAFAETNVQNSTDSTSSPLTQSDGSSNLSSQSTPDTQEKVPLTVNTPYIYGTNLTGKTAPGYRVWIGKLNPQDGKLGLIHVDPDSNGNFSVSADHIKNSFPSYYGYEVGDTLSLSVTDYSGKIVSDTVDVTIEENNSDLTAHDASVEFGSTWNDDVAKQVAGVKATDQYGNNVTKNVTVSGYVNTNIPGNYKVTFTSPETGKSKTVVITVKEAPKKPVIINNTYQEDLTGKTTPNSDVLISDNDGFNGAIKVKSDSSGNFTVTSSQLSSLNEYAPGNLLYIKSGDLANGNYGEVSTSVVRYPKPQVAPSYAYNQEITGTAYPNSKIFISDINNFGEYVTSVVDESGHFTVPVSQLMTLPGYKTGSILYVQNSDAVNSQAASEMPLITITEAQASITANDFTLEYGAEFNDEIAIEKAGAVATDAEGNVEGVKVKESNVDTSKPGEYSVTFVSDSGIEKTVKVTVKEQEATKPNASEIQSTPYHYGDNLIGTVAPGLTVKVYPSGGSPDNTLEFETDTGTFAFTAEELKKAFGDQYKANGILAVVAYDQTTGMTSDATAVMVLPSQAPTLEAESTIHVAYGSDWNDDIAKKQAKVKATDAKGNDVTKEVKVTSNPVDTSKPGNYTVEFSVTANELTTTAKTTVIVDEKQVTGSEPIIHATDTTYQVGETLNPLLGVTAEDAEDGDLTNQVKADASGVNMSKAGDYELKLSVTDKDGNTTEQTVTVHVVDQVTDGPVIKGADDTSIDLNAKFDPLEGVTAQDSQGNDLTEHLAYTGTVDTSTTGEYTINYYVYDKDGKVATTERKVTVNEPTVEPTIEAHDFEVEYGFDLTDEVAIEKAGAKATDKYGKEEAVTVKESNVDTSKPGEYSITFVSASGKEKTVKVTVKDQAPLKPTVDPIKEGAGKVTGQGQAGDKIVITVGGKEVGTGTVKADGTFEILTGTYRAKEGDVYSVQAFNSENESSEITDVKVIATAGKVNPNDYMIGDLSITGTYSGDVTTIAVFVDGVELGKTSGANVADGQFNFYVGNHIKAGQKVTVSGYDKYGKQLDKKEVSIRNGVEAPVVNDIHERETTVTGTGEVGSTIYVKDDKKNIIGQSEVKADGAFEVTIPAQSKDTKLIVMAKKGNLRSEDVNKTVLEGLPIQLTVNDIYEGDTTVTGTSEVGSKVYVKDHAKNIISQSEVKADGTYEVSIPAQKKGTKLIVMAKQGNVRSEEISATVLAARSM